MKIHQKISIAITMITAGLLSCEKDPFEDVVSHERAIEAIALRGDLVQVGPAEIDRDNSKASVKVLMEEGTDLSSVQLQLMTSYKSSSNLAPGASLNFAGNGNQQSVTVTSESGQERTWTIELVPFVEPVLGTYDITALTVFGGTGPEYGGGAVLQMTDKPWAWPEEGGPAAEYDNTLTFEFSGVTEDGKTYGTVTNAAGGDGQYANFIFADPETDVNHFYRAIPTGEGTWEHDYSNNTITFVFDDGRRVTGKLVEAGTIDLGNGLSKTIVNEAFEFTLDGVDDWDNIYSDFDKFVKKPRRYWIDVDRQ